MSGTHGQGKKLIPIRYGVLSDANIEWREGRKGSGKKKEEHDKREKKTQKYAE